MALLTPSSHSQHLQKLKRKEGNVAGNGNGNGNDEETPKKPRATPKKRAKAAIEAAETPTPKKLRGSAKKKASVNEDDEDQKDPSIKEENG